MGKTCTKCGETKSVSEFSPDCRGKYGVRADCKQCVNRYASEYRTRNRASIRAADRRYACSELGRLRKERRLARIRQATMERRGGPPPHQTPHKKCAICGEEKLRATDFYRRKDGGLQAYCKPCYGKYQYQRKLARKHKEVQ